MSMPLKNIIVSIGLLVFGIWFMYLSSELPDRNIGSGPGPGFFPGIISVFIILLSLALLFRGGLELRSTKVLTQKMGLPLKGIMIIFLFLIMVFALPYVGFLIVAIPFFASVMLLCEKTKHVYMVLGSIIIPVFLYYLFRAGFSILLPTGSWI